MQAERGSGSPALAPPRCAPRGGGAGRTSGGRGSRHRPPARASGSSAPSARSAALPPLSPSQPLLAFPSRALTPNTKLDDDVGLLAVHASEGERRHGAPDREGAGKGVVDHVARQVFRVVLDPVGKSRGTGSRGVSGGSRGRRHPLCLGDLGSRLSSVKRGPMHFSLWTHTGPGRRTGTGRPASPKGERGLSGGATSPRLHV